MLMNKDSQNKNELSILSALFIWFYSHRLSLATMCLLWPHSLIIT